MKELEKLKHRRFSLLDKKNCKNREEVKTIAIICDYSSTLSQLTMKVRARFKSQNVAFISVILYHLCHTFDPAIYLSLNSFYSFFNFTWLLAPMAMLALSPGFKSQEDEERETMRFWNNFSRFICSQIVIA